MGPGSSPNNGNPRFSFVNGKTGWLRRSRWAPWRRIKEFYSYSLTLPLWIQSPNEIIRYCDQKFSKFRWDIEFDSWENHPLPDPEIAQLCRKIIVLMASKLE
jgi:hypothetical protein